MKLEIIHATLFRDTYTTMVINTPIGCITHSDIAHGMPGLQFPGCNLTSEGDFIPAPGFPSQTAEIFDESHPLVAAKRFEIEALKATVADAVSERECLLITRAEATEAKLADIRAYVDRVLGVNMADEGDLWTARIVLGILNR